MGQSGVVIVGASLAGIRGAQALRRDGYDDPITLIGDEPHQPYDRPPLSKHVLAGEWEPDRTALVPEEKLADLDLEFRTGERAIGVDVDAHKVRLAGGEPVPYAGLLIATGARVRSLPAAEGLAGVHTLRTIDDAMALRAELDAGPTRVAVVGAGFIGAEVAATCRERGHDVAMVEALPVPLGRVLGDTFGSLCGDIHREHGVDLRVGVGVETFHGTDRVEALELADGSIIEADVVVIGIGVVPNTEWLEGSGLTLENGVVCDATCLAAPDITAAGDVARWPNPLFDEMMRVEHWDNAVEQGAAAARRLLVSAEDAEPFSPVPWFWSDQYDRKIQLAGRPRPDDEVEIITGSMDERRFAAIYGRAGRLVGVFGMNRPRHVMQYKAKIAQRCSWDDALAFARESA